MLAPSTFTVSTRFLAYYLSLFQPAPFIGRACHPGGAFHHLGCAISYPARCVHRLGSRVGRPNGRKDTRPASVRLCSGLMAAMFRTDNHTVPTMMRRIRGEVGRRLTKSVIALVVGLGGLTACGSGVISSGEPCVGGTTSPITINALAKALSHQGLDLEAQKRSALCGAGVGVAHLESPDADANTGLMSCIVRRRPIYAHPKRLRKRDSSYPKTQFFLANVECSIYPHDDADSQRRASLEQALRELERQL
jgi:hypothetical protein